MTGGLWNDDWRCAILVGEHFTLTPTLSPVSSTGQALRERGSVGWHSCLAVHFYLPLSAPVSSTGQALRERGPSIPHTGSNKPGSFDYRSGLLPYCHAEPVEASGQQTLRFSQGDRSWIIERPYQTSRQVQNSTSSSLVTPAKAGVQYGERWLLACGFPLSRE